MQIFAVMSEANPNTPNLPAAINREFPNAFFQVSDKAWLVAGTGTPKDICDKLGITNGANGAALVVEVGGYFGFANKNVWNWIKVNGTTAKDG